MKSFWRIPHLFAIGILLILVAGCTPSAPASGVEVIRGSGTTVAQSRVITTFSEVEMNAAGDVVLVAGNEPSIVIETDDNLMQYITAAVENGKLRISLRENTRLEPSRGMSVRIVYPMPLASIVLNGSGTITAEDVRFNALRAEINGSGEIRLSGSSDTFTAALPGSGTIHAANLRAAAVRAEINGSGTIEVAAVVTLDVRINGSGVVRYRGSPTVTESVTGSGQVIPLSSP